MGADSGRRPSRSWLGRAASSVRFKIVLLLLVPLVSLTTLWLFAADITLGDGLNLRHVNTIQDHFGYPSGALGSALEQERRLSLVYLGGKMPGDRASMESGRLVTDRQADLFRGLAADAGAQGAANSSARQWAKKVLSDLDRLAAERRSIDAGRSAREQVFADYTGTIGDIVALQSSLATLSDPGVTKDARTQVALARARETLSQEDALLAGSLAAGKLSFAEHVQFTKLVGTRRSLYAETVPDLRTADRAYYERIIATPEYRRMQSLEDRYTNHMPAHHMAPMAGSDVEWKTTASSIVTRMRGLELSATAAADKRAKPISDGIILRVALAGALGLVAVIASLVLSVWIARSVIRDLNRLRRTALDLANERLPSVIRRLRRGEDVDAAAEAPPLSFGTAEIEQVGQAFNAARRTAIQGAVEEAALRRSISEVFLNLARRNQTLLHRQLSLLDTMERRIEDAAELQDLFRLDHLATRMRRHAEGLIILSGQQPGRGWRNPVPSVDVARAAAAEVEDYARVAVVPMPRVSVAGPAVADLIHLLAELIENATLFSPPDTTVQISGQIVAHGFAIEVEDRGLGMDAATLANANERLAAPPGFDLSNSAQLGLFVIGRLARRHGISVTLRTSPYGGTTAIVLLSQEIVVRSEDAYELPAAPAHRDRDALMPVGAARSPADTGPIHLVDQDRPPLPQRNAYDTAERPAPRRHDAYDTTAYTDGRPVLPQRNGAAAPPEPRADEWPAAQPEPETNGGQSAQRLDSYGTGEWPGTPYIAEEEALPSVVAKPRSVFEPVSHQEPEGERPSLPRRTRQASLAPELRKDAGRSASAPPPGERSPEELRTMLSSIQQGWTRGRTEAAADEHDEEDI